MGSTLTLGSSGASEVPCSYQERLEISRTRSDSTAIRSAPLNGTRGQRGLMDRLAAGAGEFGPHNAVHPEPAGDVLQLFGDIFPEPLEFAAAAPAGFARGDHLLLTHKVIRQGLALGLRLLLLLRRPLDLDLGCRRGDLFAFQEQFQLVEGSD